MSEVQPTSTQPIADLSSFRTGLLSPDGKFYECGPWAHGILARVLGFQDVTVALKLGWIHASGGWFSQPEREVTQAQTTAIFDWVKSRSGHQLPTWF